MEGKDGKKRLGRPRLNLSGSEKKERKRQQDKDRHDQNKAVLMDLATHQRWVALAQSKGVTNRELAVLLLDMLDAAESEQPHLAKRSPRPSTSGVLFASTPGTSQFHQAAEESEASSVISGIEDLRESFQELSSDDPVQASLEETVQGEDTIGTADKSLDLDLSVQYEVRGDFVYLDEADVPDDNQDEDFDVQAELALRNRNCGGLPILSLEEEIFLEQPGEEEEEEQEEVTRSGLHRKLENAEEAAASTFHLVEECELLRLAGAMHQTCSVCQARLTVNLKPCGSATHIHWSCPSGHRSKMCTQRTVNRVHTGDIKLSSSIILSGNNYAKVAMMFGQAGVGLPSASTFQRVQNKYVCPAVEQLADQTFHENIARHAEKEDGVVLLGDGRNDSPGHTAQYLTYLFMEESTGDIMMPVFKDKRQTGRSSSKMEPLAFFEGLGSLKDKAVTIKEVVTDAHSEITAKMRSKEPAVKHSHDTWHGGKNLGKKLSKVAGKAAHRPLLPWIRDVVNHWWYCSQTCESNPELFKEKWRGVLHHVVDEHEWGSGGGVGGGRCEHGDIDDPKPYLEKGSPPHAALAQIVLDRTLLKKVPYYVNFRHTGELESVNNHILMYCSKRFSFRYPAYKCRNLLAMIDYQHHKDRAVLRDADGNDKYVARWSRRANDYVAVKCRVPKLYEYIPPLLTDIMIRRLTDPTPLKQLLPMEADDPRLVAPRLAPHSPPPVEDILQRRHVRRFESADNA